MSTTTDNLGQRLSKVKTQLILDAPFFGAIALGMPWEISTDVPTAATNGKRVLLNPDFCNGLSDHELKFLVAHECGHPMLEHTFRRHGRDPRRWNVACDYILNQHLMDEGVGTMPKGGLYDPQLVAKGGGTAEGVYALLPEDCRKEPMDDCQDSEGDSSEQSEQEAEWKVKVAQAAQAARMQGKLSAGLQRLVDSVLNPKVDWREVLLRFIVKCRLDQRTFVRPNRRFAPQGLYLPSVSGEQLGELVIAVDCSGSIDNALINQFSAEIRTIHEDLQPTLLHIIYFDSKVTHVDTFERDDTVEVKPHGGGGTSFSPVFRYMDEHDITPMAVVFLTDLDCNNFGTAPECPVLWVTNGRTQAPFGEVIKV